jgi:hypothetical protein
MSPNRVFAKHDWPSISIERGMQIDLNEQHAKQNSSIRLNSDPLSKTTVSIDEYPILIMPFCSILSPAKHDFPRISTDRGMQIVFNEHLWKHDSSILRRPDAASNVNVSNF